MLPERKRSNIKIENRYGNDLVIKNSILVFKSQRFDLSRKKINQQESKQKAIQNHRKKCCQRHMAASPT